MGMIIHKVRPGTPEWEELRAQFDTASEASVIMGAAKHTSRNEMLHLKATGTKKEFSDWTQKNVLDKGHQIEKLTLPLAQKIIGKDLFPVVGSSDKYPRLLASFDGRTMLGETICEVKQWSESKVAIVNQGNVPLEDYWQVVQQMVVSGAKRCLYIVSKDGTEKNSVYCWLDAEQLKEFSDEQKLVRSWAQFNADREKYVPVEVVEKEVLIEKSYSLPAITYNISSEPDQDSNKLVLVVNHNLPIYRDKVMELIGEYKKELKTDQDFVDRKALNAELRNAEKKIRFMQELVRGETGDVDRLCKDLEDIWNLVNKNAIAGEKQVEAREKAIKQEIKDAAAAELREHVDALNATLVEMAAHVVLPRVAGDFDGAAKSKRTLATLQNAVDTELARAKVEATTHFEHIKANLETLRAKVPEDLRYHFRDVQDLVLKDHETLCLIIANRLHEHEKAEAARLERIREEERQKLLDEQAASEAQQVEPESAAQQAIGQAVSTDIGIVEITASTNEHGEVEVAQKFIPQITYTPEQAAQGDHFELTNIHLLIAAVANERVPHRLITVDMDAVVDYFRSTGELPPGITRTITPEGSSREPCSICFSRECNGECMGDGLSDGRD